LTCYKQKPKTPENTGDIRRTATPRTPKNVTATGAGPSRVPGSSPHQQAQAQQQQTQQPSTVRIVANSPTAGATAGGPGSAAVHNSPGSSRGTKRSRGGRTSGSSPHSLKDTEGGRPSTPGPSSQNRQVQSSTSPANNDAAGDGQPGPSAGQTPQQQQQQPPQVSQSAQRQTQRGQTQQEQVQQKEQNINNVSPPLKEPKSPNDEDFLNRPRH